MLTSNVVIWSPLLNFLVPFRFPIPPTELGCSWLELPLVVREQLFRRLIGYVTFSWELTAMQFWGNYLSPGFFLFRVNNLSILSSHLINSCGAIAEAIFGLILVFINQRIWIVLGRCLFRLRSVHTFSWFLKSHWSSNFGGAETGSGAEKRVGLRREIFLL